MLLLDPSTNYTLVGWHIITFDGSGVASAGSRNGVSCDKNCDVVAFDLDSDLDPTGVCPGRVSSLCSKFLSLMLFSLLWRRQQRSTRYLPVVLCSADSPASRCLSQCNRSTCGRRIAMADSLRLW